MFTNLSEACSEAKRWKHLLNLTWLYTKASQTFSGTFSGLNLTWLHQSLPDLRNLRNLFRNLVEPDPAPAPVHTGAILPLAYAVGGIRKNLA
jgi:hypothetical protein